MAPWLATWRQKREWHREFEDLGVRQTADRERASNWHHEKLQEARRWLRKQERRPNWTVIIVTAVVSLLSGFILAAATAVISGWLKVC
jgi:hypothetical protein